MQSDNEHVGSFQQLHRPDAPDTPGAPNDLPSPDTPQIEPGDPPPDRITVAGNVYHQSTEGDPVQVSLNFERLLETHEQVFQRRRVATPEWQSLVPEQSWLQDKEVGMIVVCNNEGRYLQTHLSPEQKDELKKKVLEITWLPKASNAQHDSLLIYARESLPLTASRPGTLRIRSLAGEIRYTVFVFPR